MGNVALLLSGILVATLGCSSGTPAFHPTVPGGTPLSQLPLADLDILCVEQLEYYVMLEQSPAGHETVCRQAGRNAGLTALTPASTDADVRQACKAAHDACVLESPVVPDVQADTVACATTIVPQPNCVATVDEYDACVTALSAGWTMPGLTCDVLTVDTLRTPPPHADAGGAGLPPICVKLGTECPQLTQIFLGTSERVM
jgi:hypothetical protein